MGIATLGCKELFDERTPLRIQHWLYDYNADEGGQQRLFGHPDFGGTHHSGYCSYFGRVHSIQGLQIELRASYISSGTAFITCSQLYHQGHYDARVVRRLGEKLTFSLYAVA